MTSSLVAKAKSMGMELWRALVLGCGLAAFASGTRAEEQEVQFESPRAAGRGRTYVGAFDSDEGSRLNPATLVDTKVKFQLRFLSLDVVLGENTLDTINDLVKLTSTTDGVEFLRKFDEKYGEKQYFRGQLSIFSMRIGAFEFSPFVVNSSFLRLSNPPFPSMAWKADSYAGVNLTYAYSLNPTWDIGLTLRPMYRWYIAGELGFMNVLDFLPPAKTKFEDYTPLVSGFGLGTDIGTTWKPSKDFRWGLVVHNVGDMGYFQDFDTVPPNVKQVVSTGMLRRFHLGSWDWDMLLDVQDVMNRSGVNVLRLVHLGTELGRMVFSRDHDFGVTAGINEGYLTGGIFMDLYVVRLDLSNFATEEGLTPGQKIDRRWALTARSTMTF